MENNNNDVSLAKEGENKAEEAEVLYGLKSKKTLDEKIKVLTDSKYLFWLLDVILDKKSTVSNNLENFSVFLKYLSRLPYIDTENSEENVLEQLFNNVLETLRSEFNLSEQLDRAEVVAHEFMEENREKIIDLIMAIEFGQKDTSELEKKYPGMGMKNKNLSIDDIELELENSETAKKFQEMLETLLLDLRDKEYVLTKYKKNAELESDKSSFNWYKTLRIALGTAVPIAVLLAIGYVDISDNESVGSDKNQIPQITSDKSKSKSNKTSVKNFEDAAAEMDKHSNENLSEKGKKIAAKKLLKKNNINFLEFDNNDDAVVKIQAGQDLDKLMNLFPGADQDLWTTLNKSKKNTKGYPQRNKAYKIPSEVLGLR